MPISPAPIQETCPACGWQGVVVHPASDALDLEVLTHALHDQCPRCAHTPLQVQTAAALSSLWARCLRVLTRSA